MSEQQKSAEQLPINIEDEMQSSYLDYAMSVIVGRALPDVRDGLKPVHRRVLFAMRELGNEWNRSYKKSARVVGDVIGKYHPHGDSAVYDTIVRMAQDFSMRYLLVDGQGNFGSVDGDSAAAMRYTEVRMTRLTSELLADIDKNTVQFGPNYDGSLQEPEVLPAKYPNLLVNGSSGIAVGMATNIPPHNLGEVIDATCALIDDSELSVRDLMQYVPGPDFPTGGTIHGQAGIVSGYETGRGSVIVRAKTEIETYNKGDRERIVIHELPYQVNKARLVERIAELVRDKKVTGISDLRDESDRDGMRVAIEIKRDSQADVVLNQLYKHTPMQSSFGINALALKEGRPETLTLKAFLVAFLDHRREVVTRRTLYELNKAQARAHVLEGLSVALANIDRIIALIRAAKSPVEAKEGLMREVWERGPVEAMLERAMEEGELTSSQFVEGGYQLSDIQAQAILDMRLHRLTGLEQDKIHDEFAEILGEIARLKGILASDMKLMDVIRGELLEIKERFADPRRTQIVEAVGDFSIADLIPEEEMVVTVSHRGYIKRQPSETYQAQRRGGKGKSATGVRDEDFVAQMFVASTHDTIFCFTDTGRVFKLKVYEIPQGSRTAQGKAIINLLNLEEGEKVRQIVPVPVEQAQWEYWDLLFATRGGLIKKTALSDYANIRTNGIRAINLLDGDDLIGVALLPGQGAEEAMLAAAANEEAEGDRSEESAAAVEVDEEPVDEAAEEAAEEGDNLLLSGRIMLYARSGKAVRFRDQVVRRSGRVSQGVRGMKLKAGDQVIALAVVEPGSDSQILAISEKGFGKRTEESQFPTKGRGTQGVIGMAVNDKIGGVISVLPVWVTDQIMLITDQGTVLRTSVESIRLAGRSTQGVRVLNVAEDEQVVSVARLAESDEADKLDDELEGEVVEGSSGEDGMDEAGSDVAPEES
uniref:DNA gyrase subunit A n=1 Tax=Magnetococcus massalia (strain MO-1) TaxID=451514 RepID=A0A1S7LEQ1_MAGMO|nr:DNA gyrase, subunit A, type II topoisomerase [Candidatus Magnetococcus massalia]